MPVGKIYSALLKGRTFTTVKPQKMSAGDLATRWKDLTQHELKASATCSDKWFNVIQTKYSESWRYYHTLNHIKELFEFYDQYKSKLNNPLVVALSIWFHDVIYDPKSKENEDMSAKLFSEFAKEISLSNSDDTRVVEYILATISHKPTNTNDSDLLYFLDFDVAVLGKQSDGYKIYAQQIRNEYIHYPEDAYKKGRTAVLEKLGAGRIYNTSDFYTRFEEAAKANMKQEIQDLSK